MDGGERVGGEGEVVEGGCLGGGGEVDTGAWEGGWVVEQGS